MSPELMQTVVMFALMAGVFYFLIIRPQQKRFKEHKEMVESLKRGDEIVTQGGLIGKVAKVGDEEISVELSDGVQVRVVRQTITAVRGRPEPKPANDAKSD